MVGGDRLKKVTRIITSSDDEKSTKPNVLRVCAYARVSTDKDEQIYSLGNQRKIYEEKIRNHPGWEYVDIYYDEGITGLSTKKRDGFNKMIADAMDGKIDLIVVKSLSRFARNTIDTLTYIRLLKTKGVGVIFETENYNSLNQSDEFIITILASYAQKESQEISERIKWTLRNLAKEGLVSIGYKMFLRYKRADKHKMVIDKEQARIVKLIYRLYLEGMAPKTICHMLEAMNIPTPMGKVRWHPNRIVSILSNEKYIGDAIVQKTYSTDIISKTRIKNDGREIPKYYVRDDHPAIIRRDTFQEVQEQLKSRVKSTSTVYEFSNRIHCSLCGSNFYRHAYRNEYYGEPIFMWVCTNRYLYKENCTNIKVYENEIRYACHQIVLGLIEKYNDVKDTLLELVEKAITPKKRHASIKKCLKNFNMPCCNEVETLMWRIVITDITVSPDRTASIHIINKDVIDYALPKWSPIKNAPKPEPKRKRKPKRG